MASKVVLWNLRETRKAPYARRITRMLDGIDAAEYINSADLTAVKLHFGESGGTAQITPLMLRPVVDYVKEQGAKPFLTDTSTLYKGERGNAADHASLAALHGYSPHVTGAPVHFADGLRGDNEVAIDINGLSIKKAYIARDIMTADSLVVLSHFKGHLAAGFGGALKNVAMGCASRRGKMQQHNILAPSVVPKKCKGCEMCIEVCAGSALTLDKNRQIAIDTMRCTGCGACFNECAWEAIVVDWEAANRDFHKRMMDYAAAVLLGRQRPAIFMNFITRVTPECDCMGFSDAPICPDIGIAASLDPVALDQACIDLVNAAPPLFPSKLSEETRPGDNKFLSIHNKQPAEMGMDHAEALGIGSREYELVEI